MTSIVKWLANGRLTLEAMSPKLVVSLLYRTWENFGGVKYWRIG